MLLDCGGRRVRRAIGFWREYRLVSESEHVSEEAVSYREIEVADCCEEKCDETPPLVE